MIRRKNKIILFVAALLFVSNAQAQDIHFSQLNSAPLQVNPAFTAVDFDWRGFLNYKTQWSSVTEPYVTYAFSFEKAFFKKNWMNGFFGAGITAFRDQAGDSHLSTTEATLNISSGVRVDDKNIIAGGIQGGYAQKSISTENLRWESQYDGIQYDASLPTNEFFSRSEFSYSDFGGGLLWNFSSNEMYMTANDDVKIHGGFSAFHFNRPDISFLGSKDKLQMKYIIHAGGLIGFKNTNISVLPTVMEMIQGPSHEFLYGGLFRFLLRPDTRYTGYLKRSSFSIGAYNRWNDALIVASQVEFSNYTIGLSYDVNISKFHAATSYQGGIELSLRIVNSNPFLFQKK